MCDTYCSIHGNNGYANAPQYYVLRTLPVLWGSVISKTGLYCTDSSLHNKHNYIYQHTAKRQIFEVDISMFLRQKFCGFGSVGKPISLSVVFHVPPWKNATDSPDWNKTARLPRCCCDWTREASLRQLPTDGTGDTLWRCPTRCHWAHLAGSTRSLIRTYQDDEPARNKYVRSADET